MPDKKNILNVFIALLIVIFLIGITYYFTSPIYLATKTTKLINELYSLEIRKFNLKNSTEYAEQLTYDNSAVIYYDEEKQEYQIYFHKTEDGFLPMKRTELENYYDGLLTKKQELTKEIKDIIEERKTYS